MNKRTIAVLAALLFAFSGVTAKLYQLNNSSYLSVAENQSTLKVTVATSRGTLYDCHLQPLTNRQSVYALAATATPTAMAMLSESIPSDQWQELQEELKNGKPVTFTSQSPLVPALGIQQFTAPARYGEGQLASHVVGYVGDDTHGDDGEDTQMRAHQQRLRVGVGNNTHAGAAVQLGQIPFEFCPEGCAFYVMDLTGEAILRIVEGHAAPLGTQMGMVVSSKENIIFAVFTGYNPEETTHSKISS